MQTTATMTGTERFKAPVCMRQPEMPSAFRIVVAAGVESKFISGFSNNLAFLIRPG
jgi:hypothetical protein